MTKDANPYKQRCAAKNRDGSPCRNWAMRDGMTCRLHGGASPQARRAAEVRRIERDLRNWGTPIPETHELASPGTGLYHEYRVLIQELEIVRGLIRELGDAQALFWGKSKEEHIGAAEFAGINETFEARESAYSLVEGKLVERLVKVEQAMSNDHFRAAVLQNADASRALVLRALQRILGSLDEETQARVIESGVVVEALEAASREVFGEDYTALVERVEAAS